jgi:DGQHR domain-containing protein
MAKKKESISAVLITQGRHKFYTCTMFSDLLAKTCYVVQREENNIDGFQRYLNKNRAQEIADYIDTGFGTIPTNIVLSAQEDSDFEYDSKNKTISFNHDAHSFLILDEQHRVYGFSLARDKKLRVPVVIYEGLTREEEVTVFIDLNTKQKPVPNELLLDIKKLANAETDQEAFLNDLFDLFNLEKDSCLKGLMSSHTKKAGMISRVTLKSSFNSIYSKIGHLDTHRIYSVVNAYLGAFSSLLTRNGIDSTIITSPTILGGVMMLFPEVFQRAKDRYADKYTVDNFLLLLSPVFDELPATLFKRPGNSKKDFYQKMASAMKSNTLIDL